MSKRRRKNVSSKEFDFFIRADLARFAGQYVAIVGAEGRCLRIERTDGLATGQATVPIFNPNPGETTSCRDFSTLSPMEIEFAFRKESSGLFGSIGRPVARVIVIHRRRRVPQLFYVDSGAWCLLEEVPLLLGRLDCFRLFEISFRHDLATAFQW